MTNCPNCGTAVPENYAFCGNCGTDMRAARTFQAKTSETPSTPGAPSTPPTPSGGGGSAFDTSAYDYSTTGGPRRARPAILWLVVAAVALVCFCCGTAFGAVTLYWLEPLPTPVPVPTPEGMLLLALLTLV